MSYTGILKQAQLADKIGNYKLADILTNKLIKIAKSNPAKVFLDALDLKKVVVDAVGGAKKTIRQVAEESTSSLIVMYRKSATKADALKIIDDLGLQPRTKNALIKNLDAGDEKAIAQLNRIFEAKYQAMADAGYKVDPPKTDGPKPPDGPKPGETPPTKIGPEEAKRALIEEIEKIVAESKGDPKVIREKLKALGFDDKTIANATAGDVININTLSGATKPGGLPFLSSRHIQVGDEILELSKIDFLNAQRLLIDIKDLPEDSKLKLIKKLKAMLDRDGNLVLDARLKDTGMFDSKYFAVRATTPPPGETPGSTAPTTPGSTADEAAAGAISNPNKKPWLAWVAGIGTAALLAYGWNVINGIIVHKDTGKPVTDAEGNAAMNSALGKDPDKLNSKMYDDRMKANQQQRQNQAAQKFVDENKSKFKTQRDFYNAAKAAGDENFANDVIAIVKKDMSMDVGPRYS